ncbi:N-acetyltransferase [bacterium]|nr:N-acetyltransferase [bacterium]
MGYFKHETAIVDSGVHIGAGTKVWHFSHIMSGATLGTHCNLGQNVFIAAGVKIGSNVKIQNNVSVYSGVTLEDDVFLGPSMVFTNVNTPRSFVERKDYAETNVGKGASIGANATVVCGNNIGVYAFIGAGAVVTSPVPAYALMYGVPAKQHGWVSRNGMKLKLDENGCGICTETQEKYQLRGDELYLIEGE